MAVTETDDELVPPEQGGQFEDSPGDIVRELIAAYEELIAAGEIDPYKK